ncbi:MAG TPA: pseudouridine synthase [Xanthomonadaceae bacterium]|nr:pseudouridine synthase [Xanthomonadaceae bacterium]
MRHGLARALSKRGFCSRSQAERLVREGRVRLNGRVANDPETSTDVLSDRIEVDGRPLGPLVGCYLMLNKPRGLLTTRADESGRDTVYRCLQGADLPWLAPVGRLDRASEGLLLFSNDPAWAAAITGPGGPAKRYHVKLRPACGPDAVAALTAGVRDGGELLRAAEASALRRWQKSSWVNVLLEQGRNRQIRRMCAALGFEVERLVRVAIGGLELGTLPKGGWRELEADEVRALAPGASGMPEGRLRSPPGAAPRG